MSLQQAIHAGEFEDDFREVRTLIESLDRYGYLKFDREEYSKAVPLFEEALDLAHDHLPADDRDLTDRLANLGTALRLASRLDDAEPKVSAALDRANGDPARHSPDVRAKLTTNLAIVKLGRGDWNGADQAFLAAQALLEQAESASSVEYANLLRNRAVLEHRRNRLAEALELINAAVDLRQALAADVDPLLHSEDLAWRSIILTGLGRLSEAADDLLGSSKLRREQLRDSSLPNLDLQARNTEQAGLLLDEAGRLPEAQQALRECGDLYAQAKAMAVLETAGTSTRHRIMAPMMKNTITDRIALRLDPESVIARSKSRGPSTPANFSNTL